MNQRPWALYFNVITFSVVAICVLLGGCAAERAPIATASPAAESVYTRQHPVFGEQRIVIFGVSAAAVPRYLQSEKLIAGAAITHLKHALNPGADHWLGIDQTPDGVLTGYPLTYPSANHANPAVAFTPYLAFVAVDASQHQTLLFRAPAERHVQLILRASPKAPSDEQFGRQATTNALPVFEIVGYADTPFLFGDGEFAFDA